MGDPTLVAHLSVSSLARKMFRTTAPFRGYGMESVPGLRRAYRTIYRKVAPTGTRAIRIGDIRLRADFRDLSIVPSLWLTRRYEPAYSRALDDLVNSRSRVIDIGAHIGYYAVRFAKVGAAVVAYEPFAPNRELLAANASLNEVEHGLEIRDVAVGRAQGRGWLWFSATNTGGASLIRDCVEEPLLGSTRVNVVALDDDLPPSWEPTLIKVDVQGFEAAVIFGARGLIVTHTPDLAFEYNPAQIRANGDSPENLLGFLHDHGYALYLANEHASSVHRMSPDQITTWCRAEKTDGTGFANVIARHGARDDWR